MPKRFLFDSRTDTIRYIQLRQKSERNLLLKLDDERFSLESTNYARGTDAERPFSGSMAADFRGENKMPIF